MLEREKRKKWLNDWITENMFFFKNAVKDSAVQTARGWSHFFQKVLCILGAMYVSNTADSSADAFFYWKSQKRVAIKPALTARALTEAASWFMHSPLVLIF